MSDTRGFSVPPSKRGGTAAGPKHLARAALLALVACSTPPVQPSAPTHTVTRKEPAGAVRHVVLVSVDGLLPEAYLEPDAHGLHVPNLRRIVAQGAASDGALSVFPTLTYPAHTTIATGVSPARHGILGNHEFDLAHGFVSEGGAWRWYADDIRAKPLWTLVEEAGYTTALVQWPVTVGAHATWLVPEYWRSRDENDQKLLRALSTRGLLETVAAEHPDFWSRYTPPEIHDDALGDIATHVVAEKPTLLMLHLLGVDHAQHVHGVWSREANAAIEEIDQQIGRVLAAIAKAGESATAVVVVSDHGFMNITAMASPCVALREAGLVTLEGERVTSWKATVYTNAGVAYVYAKDGQAEAAARAALDGKAGVGRFYTKDEIAALGGDGRAAFAIEATPGYDFGPRCAGDYEGKPPLRAIHGYDPRRPEMHASLLMMGPGIAHGTLPNARLVDVAPTIASWLSIPMPGVEGKALVVQP